MEVCGAQKRDPVLPWACGDVEGGIQPGTDQKIRESLIHVHAAGPQH